MNVSLDLSGITVTPPTGETHEATSWQLSTFPDFSHKSFVGKTSLFDKDNKTTITLDIDNVRDNAVYFRYALFYSDGTTSGWSDTIKRAADTTQPMIDRVLIETPVCTKTLDYAADTNGALVISIPPISYYSGTGSHDKTEWRVGDKLDTEVFSKVSSTELTSVSVPVSYLEDDHSYTVSAKYIDANGNVSGTGLSVFDTQIMNGVYFKVAQLPAGLQETQKAFFKVLPLTTNFESYDLLLSTITGTKLAEVKGQKTITPSITLPENTGNVPVTVQCKLNFKDGSTTAYTLIYSATVSGFNIINIDKSMVYLGKYSYAGNISLNGITAQSSYQLGDGSIILGKANSSKLFRYTYVNDALVEEGPIFDLGLDSHIVLQYFTLIPLYNGNLLVNYGANTATLEDQHSVFIEFSYNSASKTLTKVNEYSFDQFWLSSAVSSSLVSIFGGGVYFVPAAAVDENEAYVKLSLQKLDMATGTLTSQDLPFEAYKHVTLVPYSATKFLVLGGTQSSTVVNGYFAWSRTNNDIYLYDTATSSFSLLLSLPDTLPIEIYNFQGYLRRDGKVVLFNATRTGLSQGDQKSYVIDLDLKTVTVELNDHTIDILPYRTTIPLNSGDFIRISTNTKDPQFVYTYISNTKTENDLVSNPNPLTPVINLVVNNGEVIDVEDLQLYESVTINGTGVLNWQYNDAVKTFTSADYIITRDTTISSADFNAGGYSDVYKLYNAELTITL